MESQSIKINDHLDCITITSASATVATAIPMTASTTPVASSLGTIAFGNCNLLMKLSSTESYASNGATSQTQSHQLVSNNSFELGAVTTSLSDDSGLPHTNSSISSGDSSRMGLCKIELIESDGEVSQFDSLDNCSDGGMSAENFNTLKKGPLAPIDPPPEFQDSPQTTLLRSPVLQNFSLKLAKTIILSAIKLYTSTSTAIPLLNKSMEIIKCARHRFNNNNNIDSPIEDDNGDDDDDDDDNIMICNNSLSKQRSLHSDIDGFDRNFRSYEIYASDSILNRHIDNIYDLPCDEEDNDYSNELLEALTLSYYENINLVQSKGKLTSNLCSIKTTTPSKSKGKSMKTKTTAATRSSAPGASSDLLTIATTSSTPSTALNVSHTRNTIKANILLLAQASEIHDFDLFYSSEQKSTTESVGSTSTTSYQRRKTPALYSPLHYHPGSNLSTGNRPNSRNSLNSRLSSSHNSLTIQTSNKADDSIFITQAMSHDALIGREISDFYNVPIDSDIYALPIDVIRPNRKAASTKIGMSTGTTTIMATSSANNLLELATVTPVTLTSGVIATAAATLHSTSLKASSASRNFRGRLKYMRNAKKRKRQQKTAFEIGPSDSNGQATTGTAANGNRSIANRLGADKRHSVPENSIEPMHMTLDEVKRFYTSIYSNSNESARGDNNNGRNYTINNGYRNATKRLTVCGATAASTTTPSTNINSINNNLRNYNNNNIISNNNNNINNINNNNNSSNCKSVSTVTTPNTCIPPSSSGVSATIGKLTSNKNRSKSRTTTSMVTTKDDCYATQTKNYDGIGAGQKKSQFSINLNLKQKFCSIFRFRKSLQHATGVPGGAAAVGIGSGSNTNTEYESQTDAIGNKIKFSKRALPPLPLREINMDSEVDVVNAEDGNIARDEPKTDEQNPMDFAANIEKVKEYGWYWGPISGEAAEKILSNEPDGSFIVRDSSDDHYIFSLTFKLNNCVRHVRIEQDQGTFSFGSCAKFKSRTIMEFIENAVESSRSGRYLFFFHRRPEHGPMRVQLTNPVSRFKHIQSLQHMCRFVIRRAVVRKDLIQTLPLPRRLLDYLSYKNCYSEQVESDSSQSPTAVGAAQL